MKIDVTIYQQVQVRLRCLMKCDSLADPPSLLAGGNMHHDAKSATQLIPPASNEDTASCGVDCDRSGGQSG